jgi:DNA-binding NarL/FixJ family response regulator
MFRTLLVEDSNFFRQLLKETLLSKFPSMDISEARSAEEAIKDIETSPPDLVFVDIKLPGENGLELTKKIRGKYPNIPVIILTSYDLPEYREAASRYQANYFLSKGATTKENILSLVNSILSGRKSGMNGQKPKGSARG